MVDLVLKIIGLIAVALAFASGCAGGNSAAPPVTGECAQDCQPTTVSATAPPSSTVLPAATSGPTVSVATTVPTTAPGFLPATAAASTPNGCAGAPTAAQQLLAQLSDAQIVGQLFMVGISSDDDLPAVLATIDADHAGNVVLYGSHWDSADRVRRAAQMIDADLGTANVQVAPFIAGNQEGGADGSFQAFYGPGFNEIPAALEQGQMDPATLTADARIWGEQLQAAGVNLDLAPVMDVVDRATARQNGPIGRYDREFGYDPAIVAAHGAAFIAGMHAAGEPVAIKHFPGLGRVQGNTDFTDQGTTDAVFSGADDPNLQPFKAGIAAGADMVMISSASYPLVDDQPAVFARAIITDLLRGSLGYNGVVISDDLGAAASVANVAPADRALRFFRAGGDILLTVNAADIAPMARAVLQQMHADPTFAGQIRAAALRVLTLKASLGLLPAAPVCSAPTPARRTSSSGR